VFVQRACHPKVHGLLQPLDTILAKPLFIVFADAILATKEIERLERIVNATQLHRVLGELLTKLVGIRFTLSQHEPICISQRPYNIASWQRNYEELTVR